MADAAAREKTKAPAASRDELVAAYKRLLQEYIDRRPSGLRLKIAKAIGKHRSFVSQITNPVYPIPVPARHLEAIFRICHLAPEEKQAFMAAYEAAHPHHPRTEPRGPRKSRERRVVEIELPIVDDPEIEREMDELLRQVARQIEKLVRKL
jgi:nitroreductase